MEFNAEIYNLFNQTNFANPPVQLNQSLGTGTNQLQPGQPFTSAAAGGAFGVYNSTVERAVGLGASRQVQLSPAVELLVILSLRELSQQMPWASRCPGHFHVYQARGGKIETFAQGVLHATIERSRFQIRAAGGIRDCLLRARRADGTGRSRRSIREFWRTRRTSPDDGGPRWHLALRPPHGTVPALASAEARRAYADQLLRRAQTSGARGGLVSVRAGQSGPTPAAPASKKAALEMYPVVEESQKIGGVGVTIYSPKVIPARNRNRVLLEFEMDAEAIAVASLGQLKVMKVNYRGGGPSIPGNEDI